MDTDSLKSTAGTLLNTHSHCLVYIYITYTYSIEMYFHHS